jgi:predicted ATPase
MNEERDGPGIPTPDQRLRVFVSSALGELAGERRAVARAISALRLTPVMFEAGARAHPPQEVYRSYLAQSDIFIGLYGERYGWVGPGMEVSGLEDEFDLARGVPRLLYVRTPAPDREPRLTALLDRIKNDATESYRHYHSVTELGRLVRDDLATLLSERFSPNRRPEGSAPTVGGGRRLPRVDTTALLGRDAAVDEVAALLDQSGVRLVTLTGPGGIGKSRLAVAVGDRVHGQPDAKTAFVALAAVDHSEQMLAAIGRTIEADVGGSNSVLDAVAEQISDTQYLLILDNAEQLTGNAASLVELLARCPRLSILATSQTALGLRAEREYPVPPLALPVDAAGAPVDAAGASVEEVLTSPAVALFVDRARALRPDFTLDEANSEAVVEICRRLEGVPLAIELAAARTRLLSATALVDRLCRSLDALGAGTADLPARQRTLRATVEWSEGLLDEDERSMLEVVAIFVDGWTIEAAAQIAGLDEDSTLDLNEALARHSLISVDDTRLGARPRMLQTVREYVAERLAARPDAAEIERRRSHYYRRLSDQSDQPLRGAGWVEWAGRLEAERHNIIAATRWCLDHEPQTVPHVLGSLLPLWALNNEFLGEARAWVERLMPNIDDLDRRGRMELLLAAAVSARESASDADARAAHDALAPLLDAVDDPYLAAVSELAMSWTAAIVEDLDEALRNGSAGLERLRGLDEPLWTAVALVTVGSIESAVGQYDDAHAHLTEMRTRAEQLNNARLITSATGQLGSLAVLRGRPEEARPLLREALARSLTIRSARNLAQCLAAYAMLAESQDAPERAAELAGAEEGLRHRAGLRPWPIIGPHGTRLTDDLRLAIGPDQFYQAFARGAQLNQRQALALATQA